MKTLQKKRKNLGLSGLILRKIAAFSQFTPTDITLENAEEQEQDLSQGRTLGKEDEGGDSYQRGNEGDRILPYRQKGEGDHDCRGDPEAGYFVCSSVE